MAKRPHIALVEIGGSHDECLMTQILALKDAGAEISLVCNESIWVRNHEIQKLVDHHYTVNMQGGSWSKFMAVRYFAGCLRKSNVDKVVFNTAQGGHIRNAVFFSLFSRMEFIGIIHTIRKFQGSFTQRIINWKIKRYLLLSEHLLKESNPKSKLDVDYFYPIDFPIHIRTEEKKLIVIIGGVEERRKDLNGFMKMTEHLKDDYHFVFLGKTDLSNPDLKTFTSQVCSRANVRYYDHFVSEEEFGRVLSNAHAILPLVHPGTESAGEYFKNQISGAMTVAFGYKLPILLHEEYGHIEEMKKGSVTYTLEGFEAGLEKLEANYATMQKYMDQSDRYDPKAQQERYRKFVLG